VLQTTRKQNPLKKCANTDETCSLIRMEWKLTPAFEYGLPPWPQTQVNHCRRRDQRRLRVLPQKARRLEFDLHHSRLNYVGIGTVKRSIRRSLRRNQKAECTYNAWKQRTVEEFRHPPGPQLSSFHG